MINVPGANNKDKCRYKSNSSVQFQQKLSKCFAILQNLCPDSKNDPEVKSQVECHQQYNDLSHLFRPPEGECTILSITSDQAFVASSKQTEEASGEQVILNVNIGYIHDDWVKQQFVSLISEYRDIFASGWSDVGRFPMKPAKIQTYDDAVPVRSRPYTFGFNELDILKQQLTKLLKATLICRSNSAWASPCLFVDKPNGDKRLVIDYKGLNDVTIPDRYAVRDLNQLLVELSGCILFSNYDLIHGYYHVPLDAATKHKTAFITPFGLFEWNVLPMGLINAPSIFQRIIDEVIEPHQKENLGYLDDIITKTVDPMHTGDSKDDDDLNDAAVPDLDVKIILIPQHNNTPELKSILTRAVEAAHLAAIRRIFKRFREYNVKLKLRKCSFFKTSIKFLGHLVTRRGIEPNKEYIKIIQNMRIPTNKKQLGRFLGMVGWIQKFCPLLSYVTAPLSELRRKNNKFAWTKECDKLFAAIKQKIQRHFKLQHPDFNKKFFVQTDASNYAMGAVLLQHNDEDPPKLAPVEFASRKLDDNERKLHCSELELLSILWAIRKWRKYLLPNHFHIANDHKNLVSLFNKITDDKNAKLRRMILRLQEYSFDCGHICNKDNVPADYLSRDTVYNDEPAILVICGVAYDHQLHGKEMIIPCPVRTRSMRNRDAAPDTQRKPNKYNKRTGNLRDNPTYIAVASDEPADEPVEQLIDVANPTHVNYQALHSGIDWKQVFTVKNLVKEQQNDTILRSVRRRLLSDSPDKNAVKRLPKPYQNLLNKNQLTIKNHVVCVRGDPGNPIDEDKIFVPASLRNELIHHIHVNVLNNHQGRDRTTDFMKRKYFWFGLTTDIRNYVKTCKYCQMCKADADNRAGPMILNEATYPFQSICIDLVGPLPPTEDDFEYILTIIDRYSNYVAAVPLKDVTAITVMIELWNNWICAFGVPETILTDRGQQIAGELMKILAEITGLTHNVTTVYHPQCNGKIERWHRYLKERLKLIQLQNGLNYFQGDDWTIFIPSIVFSYNVMPNRITRFSPFEMVFGHSPVMPIDVALKTAHSIKHKSGDAADWIKILKINLQNISKTANVNRYSYNSSRKKSYDKVKYVPQYKVGDDVLIYVKDRLSGNLAKLNASFDADYKISRILSNNNVMVKNLMDGKEYTLHVSKIRKLIRRKARLIRRGVDVDEDERKGDEDEEKDGVVASEIDDAESGRIDKKEARHRLNYIRTGKKVADLNVSALKCHFRI